MDDGIERLADKLIGDITGWHPIGWQGPAQHTWTMACDGFHEPGPCPQPAVRSVVVDAALMLRRRDAIADELNERLGGALPDGMRFEWQQQPHTVRT